MGEEDLINHAVLCICSGGSEKMEGCMLSVNVLLKFQNIVYESGTIGTNMRK